MVFEAVSLQFVRDKFEHHSLPVVDQPLTGRSRARYFRFTTTTIIIILSRPSMTIVFHSTTTDVDNDYYHGKHRKWVRRDDSSIIIIIDDNNLNYNLNGTLRRSTILCGAVRTLCSYCVPSSSPGRCVKNQAAAAAADRAL